MLRINKQGFTLIELMVVIVIIGVLASLAIPRFTEASSKAKMGEAPRIIASYESGYLAALAEKGEVTGPSDLIVKIPQGDESKWFTYTLGNDASDITAEAIKAIGVFPATGTLVSTYNVATTALEDCFVRTTSDVTAVEKLIPNFALISACPAVQ
jgi:prepilin-type N-terminal cleavage/methylation domain-containing protein